MTDNLQDIYTLQIRRHGNSKGASPFCEACRNGYLHVNSLQVRQFTQTGKLPGVCKSCNVAFLKICRLQIRHLTQNEHQPHVCTKCPKSFTHAGNYRKHMLLHEKHGDNPLGVNGVKANNHPKPPFKCEKCERSFLKYGSFVKHCVNHDTKHTCDICDKVFNTKQLLKGHMYSHRIEQQCYVCKLCKETFSVPTQLEEHLIKHVEERARIAQMPNKGSTAISANSEPMPSAGYERTPKTESVVSERESGQLPEIVSEQIPIAETEIAIEIKSEKTQESNLEDSNRLKHFCSVCQKGFVHLKALKNHFSMHTGDLRFQCRKCDRKFLHAFNLKKHAQTHLKYRYCCKVCNKVFRSSKVYKAHSFTHKKKKQTNKK